MLRPLAVIGISYISALVVALILGNSSFEILCGVWVTGTVISLAWKKLRKDGLLPTVFITALTATMMLWGYTAVYVEPSTVLKGVSAEVTGELCELPYQQNDRYYYRIRTSSIEMPNVPQNITVLVSSRYKIKIEPYDTLKATVRFYSDTDPTQELYNIAKGITIRGSVDLLKRRSVTANDNKPLYYYALMTRRWITDRIKEMLPERESGFVNAVLTGDKYSLQSDDQDNMRSSGISHIAVVSGFHLSVIVQLMWGICRVITRGHRKLSSALCIIFVFLYMAVTGFAVSVVRAGVMQIFLLLSKFIGREYDSLNILGLSAGVICFVNPYAVMDISFSMSFCATLGILLISGKMISFLTDRIHISTMRKHLIVNRFLTGVILIPLKAVVGITAVSASAYLFVLPIMIAYFQQVALYAVLTNTLIGFAVPILVYTAVFMVITGINPLIWIVWGLTDYILWTAEKISDFPFAVIVTAQEFIPYWLTVVVIVGIMLFWLKCGRKAYQYYAVVSVMALIICSVGDSWIKSGSIKVSVLDTGNGISCIVNYGGNTCILSSGGSYYKSHALDEYLTNSCTDRINYLLLLDDKNACTAFAKQILEDYAVETVQIYDKKDYTENIRLLLEKCDHEIESGIVYIDDIKIQTVKEKNCMAVYVKIGSFRLVMIEGKTDCENIPSEWYDTDILVVNGNIQNIELISADIAVISDEYERIGGYDTMSGGDYGTIYATAGSGDIMIRTYSRGQMEVRRENGWVK